MDLLDTAVALDEHNERLYQSAMGTRHTLSDFEGIRALFRALTRALADSDAEPSEETVAPASRLSRAAEAEPLQGDC
jgi:hypothetical protein